MTTTISQGGTSIVPDLVLGYEADIEVNNIIHPIIGREQFPDVTFRTPALRTGTLEIFCLTEDGAAAALALHSTPTILDLDDSTWPTLNMRYVTRGTMRIRLDAPTGRWVVSVGYQELPNGSTPLPPTMIPGL